MSAHPPSPTGSSACGQGLLLPMGGGYGELIPGLAAALYSRSQGRMVKVAMLPASFSSNAHSISAEERQRSLQMAERRRLDMEAALQAAAPAGTRCSVVLVPVLTRADAEDRRHLALFEEELSAAFLLGGDQSVAMQVLAGTPIEGALHDLHSRGGIIAGTSAGAGMQSHTMLAGYVDQVDAPHPLEHGITAIWNHDEARGLSFGQQGMIIDQHFFQRGRIGRLLEAIVRPGSPHVGAGIDAFTGLHVQNRTVLQDVFGLFAVAILDAASLGAAEAVRYCGERKTVSVRSVLVHLLAPGPFAYDLEERCHSLAARPQQPAHAWQPLRSPAGAGLLLLSGGAGEPLADAAILAHFLGGAGRRGPLLVAALDAAHIFAAQQCAEQLAGITRHPVEFVYGYDGLAARVASATVFGGIVAAGGGDDEVDPACLEPLARAWRAGTALWLAGAAAGWAGSWRCGRLPAIDEQDALRTAQQRAPLLGATPLLRGLDLLPITLEPRVLEECRWSRLFTLAYERAGLPALALGTGATLAVTATGAAGDGSAAGAAVLGQGSVFVLDLRGAERALGDNGAYVLANGLLDAFAAGDEVLLRDL